MHLRLGQRSQLQQNGHLSLTHSTFVSIKIFNKSLIEITGHRKASLLGVAGEAARGVGHSIQPALFGRQGKSFFTPSVPSVPPQLNRRLRGKKGQRRAFRASSQADDARAGHFPGDGCAAKSCSVEQGKIPLGQSPQKPMARMKPQTAALDTKPIAACKC